MPRSGEHFSDDDLRHQHRLQAVLDRVPMGVFRFTPQGGIISGNEALVEMFGYDRLDELIASPPDMATAAHADPADWEELMRLLEENGQVLGHESRFLRRDGSEFWGTMNAHAVPDEEGRIVAYHGFIADISKQKQASEELKRMEWMLSGNAGSSSRVELEAHEQGYGDLSALNTDGIILKYIGRERLEIFANDYLELLGTSSAIYEANGDYAFGIFASGWCRMLDCASRDLCGTSSNAEALDSGRWLCHESCWSDCSTKAIAQCAPVDIECNGGLRIYAVPIQAHGRVVGAINFGYGDPPRDREALQKISQLYRLEYEDLVCEANAYDSRPPFIIEQAKIRLHSTARLIGALVEARQTEEALRKSEERFRTMLDAVPDLISIHSPEMDILYSNWREFGGVPEAERRTNTKCYRTYRGLDEICPDCLAKGVLETGKPLQRVEQLQDGAWVDLRVIPLLDSNNRVEMLMKWARDITASKQAAEALRKSEEALRTTLNSIGDAVISTDKNGRVVSMNPVAESLTGWIEQAAVNQPLEVVFPIFNEQTREPVESPVTKVLKSGGIVGLANHTMLVAKDGQEIPIADSSAPIRNVDGEITGVVLVFRDQTEERANRKAMETNYELLQIAGETSGFGGWSVDLETNTCIWSDTVADIHEVPRGYAPPIQEGIEFYAPEWRERITEVFTACAESGIPYDEELEIITRNGRRLWVRTCGRAVREEQGKVIRVHGSFQDITRKRRTEDELRNGRQRLELALEGGGLGTWDWNLRTDAATYSDRWAQMLEYAPDEVEPSADFFKQHVHPDDLPAVLERLIGHVEGRLPVYESEHRVRTKSGLWRWVRDRGKVVMRDDDNRPVRVTGVIADITERKDSEVAIREMEQRNQALLDYSPVCHKIVDLDLNLRYMNACGFNMLGLEGRDDLFGKPYPFDFFPEECRRELTRVVKQVIETGERNEIETLACDHAGNDAWLHHTILPVNDMEGAVAYVTVVTADITEQRRMQDRIRQSEKMDAIGQLAGGIAHDFNNMLGVIIGHTEMALENADDGQPLRDDLQEIRKAAERSRTLTRQLLAFARKQTVAPRIIDLSETVAGMLTMLRRLIGEDLEIVWHPSKSPAQVKIDPSQIDQVLTNLCVNARDAIDGVGKVIIETDIVSFDEAYCAENTGFVPGDYVLLAVSDNGCGMEQQVLNHLFEPFFTTKGQGRGTGLGLASVYGAIKQNDGFIKVYSEPGQGSTFKLYMPRQRAGTPLQAEKAKPKPVMGENETVLLVEDEPALLRLAKLILENLGYHVMASSSPDEALGLAREHSGRIDVLLTDVIMPEMNGRDLARQLQTVYPGIKLLFTSGYPANIIAHHGVLDDGVYFIQKPFSSQDLGAKMREVLEGGNAG